MMVLVVDSGSCVQEGFAQSQENGRDGSRG